jgi:hypothetical protein
MSLGQPSRSSMDRFKVPRVESVLQAYASAASLQGAQYAVVSTSVYASQLRGWATPSPDVARAKHARRSRPAVLRVKNTEK